MFGHVGQRLGRDEVGGGFDARVQSPKVGINGQINGYGTPPGQRRQRARQAPVGENRRSYAAGEGSEFVQRVPGLADRLVDCCPYRVRIRIELGPGPTEVHRQPDQALLWPVVDVAFQPSQGDRFGGRGRLLLRLQAGDLLAQLGDAA